MKAKTTLRFALTHAAIAILPLAYADGEALVMSADGSISVDVREGDRRAVSPGAVCYSPMWGGIEQDGAYVALYKVTNVDAANPTTNEVARFSSDNEGEGSYSLFVGDEDEHCFRLIHRVYSPGGDEIGTPLVRDVAFGFESSEGEESVVDCRSNSLQLMQNSSGGVKLAYDTAWATNAASVTISSVVLSEKGGSPMSTNDFFTASADACGDTGIGGIGHGWMRLLCRITDESGREILEYTTDEFNKKGGFCLFVR